MEQEARTSQAPKRDSFLHHARMHIRQQKKPVERPLIEPRSTIPFPFSEDPENAEILQRISLLTLILQNAAEEMNRTVQISEFEDQNARITVERVPVELVKVNWFKTETDNTKVKNKIGEETPHISLVVGPTSLHEDTPKKKKSKRNKKKEKPYDLADTIYKTLYSSLINIDNRHNNKTVQTFSGNGTISFNDPVTKSTDYSITNPSNTLSLAEFNVFEKLAVKSRGGDVKPDELKQEPKTFKVALLKGTTNDHYHSLFVLNGNERDPRKIFIWVANKGLDVLLEGDSIEKIADINPELDTKKPIKIGSSYIEN